MATADITHSSGFTWQVQIADSFAPRFMGLMGRPSLAVDQGLLFPDASSLHMLFMRFAIDVVFLDKPINGLCHVVALRANLAPWSGAVWGVRGAWGSLELAAGSIDKVGLRLGDELKIVTT